MRLTAVVVFWRRCVASLCATLESHASGSRQTSRAGEPALPKRGDDPSYSFSSAALSHLVGSEGFGYA